MEGRLGRESESRQQPEILKRLEDLKLELRRRFDLPATKNDIARCALQGLYEDYARDPEKSRIVRYLRAKHR